MDSDSPTTLSAATSSSTALPDSAIYGDLDKLSPITAVKTSLATTDFPCSHIRFASPSLIPSAGSYTNSLQFPPPSSEDIRQHDHGSKNTEYTTKNKFQSSSSLIHCTQRERDNVLIENQFSNPSVCFDNYLVDDVEIEYDNTKNSYDLIQAKFGSIDNPGKYNEESIVSFPDMLQLKENDLQENPSFKEKPLETNAKLQDTGPEQKNISYDGSEFFSQSRNSVNGYQDVSEASGEVSCEKYENNALPVVKGQRSHGLQRRCLQFENTPSNTPVSERNAISVNSDKPLSIISFTRQSNSRSTISKPSGIGLHLNSIMSSKPMCVSTCISIMSDDKDVQGEQKLVSCSDYYPQESSDNGTISLKMGERIFSTTSQNQEATDSHCPNFGASNDGKRKFFLEQASAFEESTQSSPKKKSKKASVNSEDNSCKRCSCKKTKCLKLYCDCFAAGIYCSGVCSCQGCFNRPDYVDTVLEVRQLIESRNPYAFAPKIVEHSVESNVDSTRKDEVNSTPASARHKRGCNCKKSMCMKKYCECYQVLLPLLQFYCDCFAAGIYCSGVCSCQGCFNRPDYVDTVLEVRQLIESRNPYAFAPKIVEHSVESNVDSTRKDEVNSTPASARHKRGCNCKKSMCMKKYCECYQNNVGCSSGCRCEGCQNVHGKKDDHHWANDALVVPISEAPDEIADLLPNQDFFLQNELNNHHSITPTTPSFPLLKRYISPESDLSLMQKCGGSLETTDNCNVLLLKSKKSDAVSSHTELNGGDNRSIDVFSRTDKELAEIGNSSRVQKLDNLLEDETSEMLKDPTTCVKVNSSNKKRISPPRICGLQQLGSSFSSAALKSGRKFILRAIPSFQPLTPCIDGKNSSSQSKRI